MQNWDMLRVDAQSGAIWLYSTNPGDLRELAEAIVREAHDYFSYVTENTKKLEIRISETSKKGHEIHIHYSPSSEYLPDSEKTILNSDFRNFVLNILIARNWQPYPGDGEGKRFIRYNE